MAGEEGKYTIKAAVETVKVIVFLAEGDILGWKSVQQVADALRLSKDKTFRLLRTLCDEGFVEQSKKGFRQSNDGIIKHALYAKNYWERMEEQYGVKKARQLNTAQGGSTPRG